jgi:hypothetical protein
MHRGCGASLSVRMSPTTSTRPLTRRSLYRGWLRSVRSPLQPMGEILEIVLEGLPVVPPRRSIDTGPPQGSLRSDCLSFFGEHVVGLRYWLGRSETVPRPAGKALLAKHKKIRKMALLALPLSALPSADHRPTPTEQYASTEIATSSAKKTIGRRDTPDKPRPRASPQFGINTNSAAAVQSNSEEPEGAGSHDEPRGRHRPQKRWVPPQS